MKRTCIKKHELFWELGGTEFISYCGVVKGEKDWYFTPAGIAVYRSDNSKLNNVCESCLLVYLVEGTNENDK